MSSIPQTAIDQKSAPSLPPASLQLRRASRPSTTDSVPRKRIWIDLDNSPHVPFFKPIAEELERRGYSVNFSARDCFQVRELADLMKLNYHCVGRHYGKHTAAKMAGLFIRALQLLPYVLRKRPQLAVSHGSRSMFVLASVLRIPTITIIDYEHVRWMWAVGNAWAMLPEVIPTNALKLPAHRILKYPGIKEDVYAPSFQPDPAIYRTLGIDSKQLVITLRPPASDAHYHNPESEVLLDAVFKRIANIPDVKVVLMPRTPSQEAELRVQWQYLFASGTVIVPEHAVDGLNLIWFSDLVISGGGTMNREAAALGVPVYSIFRGTLGAVDEHLARSGRLVLLQSLEDVQTRLKLVRRERGSEDLRQKRNVLSAIVDHIEAIADPQPEHVLRATPGREEEYGC